MTEIGDIIFLDLDKVNLFGWEKYKSDKVVFYVAERALLGDDFPPVPVVKIDKETYQLDFSSRRIYDSEILGEILIRDGGHKRAVGHYLAGLPLKCSIRAIGINRFRFSNNVNIRDVVLADDDSDIANLNSFKEKDPNYGKPCYREVESHC